MTLELRLARNSPRGERRSVLPDMVQGREQLNEAGPMASLPDIKTALGLFRNGRHS